MKTYLISIEENNSPRLLKTLSQPFFQDGELPVMKLGVKGGELNAKEYFELGVKGRSKPLSPSMVGCTLSHLEALKAFLGTNDQYALILEDDAIIPDYVIFENLKNEIERLKFNDAFLFSLGGIQMKECRKVRGKILVESFLNRYILKVHPDFYHRVCYTVAYVIDRKMAENLIEYHKKMRAADDWRYIPDLYPDSSIYMTAVVDHPVFESNVKDPTFSTIEDERTNSGDVPISKHGSSLHYNFSKFFNTKYPL